MHQSRIKITVLCLLFGGMGLSNSIRAISSDTDSGSFASPDETVWFTYPAQDWNSQSLHLGNGYMGASFYGGIARERFDIAEETFFSGGPNVTPNYNYGIKEGGKEHIAQIRQLILEGKYAQSDSLCSVYFKGDQSGFGHFSAVGQLFINFKNHNGEVKNYVRSLDLANSLGNVSYQLDGTGYSREYFCSYPDKALVCRFSADKTGKISFDVEHLLLHECKDVKFNISDKAYEITFTDKLKINGLDFCIRIALVSEGGLIAFKDQKLSVEGANNATLIYVVDTEYKATAENYKGLDPVSETQKNISKALLKGYKGLKDTHLADYKNLYNRVKFTLAGNPDMAKLPTNERFALLKAGATEDSNLKALYFNLGRYLLISASRPGTLPSNLQGVWNHQDNAPWAGNFQSNVNLQEMYWSCGPTNLPECQEAYIQWVEDMVPSGRKTAAAYYGTKGWISHTQGNIFAYTAPGLQIKWGLYTMGSAWHCRHVWSQYEYTRDLEYLKTKAYPILKEAAEFWLENLVEKDGKLISIPTVSAEHGIQIENGEVKKYADHDNEPGNIDGKRIYSVPCFQDIEMIYDLFTNVAKASDALNIDKVFRNQVIAARNKLEPLKIGKYGQLQEWLYDYDNARDHHRHISHLYAVYPGEMISVRKTPELAEAAKVSLNMRDEGFVWPIWPWAGGNWSMAMRAACWARLHDGERAIKVFNLLMKETGLENGMTAQPANHKWYGTHDLTIKPPTEFPMQVDASMATPGIFAEMLLQSEDNNIYLLPALPAEWPEGEITGLCAKGGYVVDISWEYGQLTKAKITVPKGAKNPILFAKGKPLQKTDKRLIINN
jgi:alpha-L-fucosidase 2